MREPEAPPYKSGAEPCGCWLHEGAARVEGSEGGSKPVDVIFDPSPGGRGRAATDGVKMRAGKGIVRPMAHARVR